MNLIMTDYDIELYPILIMAGADLDSTQGFDKNTALMVALDKRRVDIAKLLIEAGADIDKPGHHGYSRFRESPFEYAISYAFTEIIKLFMQDPDNVNRLTESGKTPLTIAAWRGQCDLIEYLIKLGADINMKNNYGNTALSLAVAGGEISVVKLLLDLGADPNILYENNETVLMVAASDRGVGMVKLLLEAGANIRVVDKNGLNALDHARNNVLYKETYKFLQNPKYYVAPKAINNELIARSNTAPRNNSVKKILEQESDDDSSCVIA